MLMRVLNSSEMKRCDEFTINERNVSSATLMHNAAKCTSDEIIASGFDLSEVLVVCGVGNNGGDGFAVAYFLHNSGKCKKVHTFFIGSNDSMTDGCFCERKLARECGIEEDNEFDAKNASLIVDAIFGIGLSRPISGKYEKIINEINSSPAKKVAVDIPSGISADNGAVMGCAVKADLTVTFAAVKRGELLFPGRMYCGKLICHDIGVGFEAVEKEKNVFTSQNRPFPIPKRKPDSNKGTYGKVLIVGGGVGMAGAVYLSALAAYRVGAGLVRIFTSEENRIILQTLLPEAVIITYHEENSEKNLKKTAELLENAISDATAVVIGPGLSQSEMAKFELKTVLESVKCPLVIDADALNILAFDTSLWKDFDSPVIITPHIGEMSRLTGIEIPDLKANPIGISDDFASSHGVICVLKDATTVVSDRNETYINTSGTNAMSKAGSGDILTGVIAALLAMGMSPKEAACLGVYLHGRAGECAAAKLGDYSLIARDLAENLTDAIKAEIII